jgi:hypothetical protein
MIYDGVNFADPIQQGDIFRNVPRVDFSLSTIAIIDANDEARETSWREALNTHEDSPIISAVLPIKSVIAIAITQNCDAVRGEFLSLCQIDQFLPTIGQKEPPKTPKKWQSLITEFARTNQRLFYLPEAASIGFATRMVVDFRVILRIPRLDLESLKDQRVARLNRTANEHFRESLAHFFRRYAYNEWYPLTKEEFQAYSEACLEPIKPYNWQE